MTAVQFPKYTDIFELVYKENGQHKVDIRLLVCRYICRVLVHVVVCGIGKRYWRQVS